MDLRHDLKEQYHASLAMLADCIERCPNDLWESGTFPRTFCRIAYHAAFFTHLYLGQNEAAFQPWTGHSAHREALWGNPEPTEPLSQQETLDYIASIDSLVSPTLDTLDLDSSETGFHWYPAMSKLSHEIMNLRHIQGHIGQLSELLMARGIDTDWVGKAGSWDA